MALEAKENKKPGRPATMNVDPETGEATPAKAPKASKVSVADAPEDDLPF